jgi:hypothetical protein
VTAGALERLNIQYPTRNIQPMKGRKDELIQKSEKIDFFFNDGLNSILFKVINKAKRKNCENFLGYWTFRVGYWTFIIFIFCVFTHSKMKMNQKTFGLRAKPALAGSSACLHVK